MSEFKLACNGTLLQLRDGKTAKLGFIRQYFLPKHIIQQLYRDALSIGSGDRPFLLGYATKKQPNTKENLR